ncbi:putative transcription regulator [Burkholderia phage AMP1]|uniref:Uncharacterized protein n=4 Tax=Ampunavirus BpAMP1 TaxID=2733589 RepID=A0A0A1I623_9CAUD|nr:hypothetical protein HOQ94_gp17 [Burkholderia phage Bp-AMP1]QEP52841.1 putative transcription regulator [Burkholderia phage AMP1]CDK30086.1 hypothetical protein [Burkholderia phage Bp-AMP1]CDL65172.1 hypothetical protein [Burkholderia phage Bp-AMP2]CDL65212.1 hypothetical protein [Burkholderia phage Bp-AMP3]
MNGEQLKAEGQAKALKRAGSEWLATALAKLKEYATGEFCYGVNAITIDTFRIEGGCPEPKNPNAWGALPKAAVRAGILLPTDRTSKAARPQAQARVVRVWEVNPAVL